MPPWRFVLALDPADELPVFLRIARALTDEIVRGRLAPGARLPGSRGLAAQMGVHRNTVSAAYDELIAEGWLTTGERRGTFVSAELPTRRLPQATARATGRGFELPQPDAPVQGTSADGEAALARLLALPPSAQARAAPLATRVLSMAGGVPDLRQFPAAALARAYRHALRRGAPALLDYGDVHGHPALRAELARMLAEERALVVSPDDVLVTQGAQEALYLLGQVLCAPGDAVAVEGFGYRPAWEALGRRAALIPIPVDADGLDVGALERVVRRRRLRAVYVTPHHQYPTMATLSAARRLRLLSLAAEHRVAVIEDDYDHELHYEGRPVVPLASADRAGVVLYVGTLSKVLAPGLRLGFLVAGTEVRARAAALRLGSVRQGDHALQQAVATLFAEGEVQRHVRRMRRSYAARRACVVAALERRLGGVVSVRVPTGGMALWVEVAPDVDPELWAARALERGVRLVPGRQHHFGGAPTPHLRVGYGGLDEAELEEAVARLARALPKAHAASPATQRVRRSAL